ncbi:glutamate racemase [Oceanivirga salmonicida]|uniref:glutamate racemase n=1 Tax=Oceanivirga salmonicida TaxID=1769291 RepID=UPI000830A613|nr:glutamate racemase [Oceanivirga salmonicida]
MAIGIFDSGVGGLTVLKELKKKYPNNQFIYFGDLGNFPYGKKTNDEIIKYSKNITEFMLSKNIKDIVIACNTATAIAYDILKKEYSDINFYGIIDSVCEQIKSNNITVIGTNATVRSNIYKNRLLDKVKYQIAAPKLVEYAERVNKNGVEEIIKEYISADLVEKTDILLACTHFPLLNEKIKKVYPNINLIDPAIYLANTINFETTYKEQQDIFYTSGELEYFKIQLKNILGKENIDVRVHKWNTNC